MKQDYIEYEPAVLKKLQAVEKEMLNDFVFACDKYGIDYFGVGGTAIGAVRHGGMIPWDDDIDIGYRRRDESKIINAVKSEFGDKYWFANPRLTPGFPYVPTHMCMTGTEFVEKAFDESYESGIFLDLYPFDDAYSDSRMMKKQGLKAWFWGKLYVLYFASRPILYFGGAKATAVRILCRLGNRLMHFLKLDPIKFYERAVSAAGDCEKRGGESDKIAWFFDPKPFSSLIDFDCVFPTKKIMFDGMEVRFPGRVEKYLEARYGDFMKLPPVEQRHNHPPAVLRFRDED